MNALHLGFSKKIELPPGGFLYIANDVPDIKRARVFDYSKHSFNPLTGLDYKTARQIADVLYTIYPQGENTLTVRNGRRGLLDLLLAHPERLDKIRVPVGKVEAGTVEAMDTIKDIVRSPVLRRVLCNNTNFSFNPNSRIVARINRVELGEFDAHVLGLFLIAHFKGQIVIEDGGFYLRESHISLIRERRLIVGLNTLAELPPKLRQAVLLIPEKIASGTTFEDAVTLAQYARLRPDPTRADNDYNRFIDAAMA